MTYIQDVFGKWNFWPWTNPIFYICNCAFMNTSWTKQKKLQFKRWNLVASGLCHELLPIITATISKPHLTYYREWKQFPIITCAAGYFQSSPITIFKSHLAHYHEWRLSKLIGKMSCKIHVGTGVTEIEKFVPWLSPLYLDTMLTLSLELASIFMSLHFLLWLTTFWIIAVPSFNLYLV